MPVNADTPARFRLQPTAKISSTAWMFAPHTGRRMTQHCITAAKAKKGHGQVSSLLPRVARVQLANLPEARFGRKYLRLGKVNIDGSRGVLPLRVAQRRADFSIAAGYRSEQTYFWKADAVRQPSVPYCPVVSTMAIAARDTEFGAVTSHTDKRFRIRWH